MDKRGRTRDRELRAFRRYFDGDKRIALHYTAPANVRGTALLTYDYAQSGRPDDHWLYLPALRKVRRIPAGDRGDYFLGTDFTYDDIRAEGRLSRDDYQFRLIGAERFDDVDTWLIEGVPVDSKTAADLGYSRVRWHIDSSIWLSRKIEMWDMNGNPLKTIRNEQIDVIQGIATPVRIRAENRKTGHETLFEFQDIDYETPIDERVFEQNALRRGL